MMIDERPVLITDAARSYEAQHAARRRRYATLMGSRLALFVLAAAVYPMSMWLAVGLLALSVPLPWMAVLIANDAPAHQREDPHRLGAATPVSQLETPGHDVVDGTP